MQRKGLRYSLEEKIQFVNQVLSVPLTFLPDSILDYPSRRHWGKASYHGNCTGYLIKDLLEKYQPKQFGSLFWWRHWSRRSKRAWADEQRAFRPTDGLERSQRRHTDSA